MFGRTFEPPYIRRLENMFADPFIEHAKIESQYIIIIDDSRWSIGKNNADYGCRTPRMRSGQSYHILEPDGN